MENDRGFKITCNNCGNVVEVRDDTRNKDYEKEEFCFYPIQSERISICCNKCGNDVYIDENFN